MKMYLRLFETVQRNAIELFHNTGERNKYIAHQMNVMRHEEKDDNILSVQDHIFEVAKSNNLCNVLDDMIDHIRKGGRYSQADLTAIADIFEKHLD